MTTALAATPLLQTDRVSTCRRLMDLLLVGLLAFSVGAFGSTEAWSMQITALLAAALALVVAVDGMLRPSLAPVRTWAYLPIALFVALVLLQLFPLPEGLLRLLSPGTVALRADLSAGVAPQTTPGATLSLYPPATWRDLRVILLASCVFVVVLHAVRTARQVEATLGIIAGVGTTVALFALYQNLTGTRYIYGGVEVQHPASGPFANHSHFSQFMNLCVGAGVALLLARLTHLERRGYRIRHLLRAPLRQPRLTVHLLIVGVVLSAAMMCLSMSRGGVVSLAVALVLVIGLLVWRRGIDRRVSVLLSVALLVLTVLTWISFDAVYERLATLHRVEEASGSRFEILRDLAVAWRQFPVLGTGPGTHEFIFPLFDRSTVPTLATHAENEYAQLMLECGLVGVVLMTAFVAVVFGNLTRALRGRRSVHVAGYGVLLGLVAVMVHSATDFGQHVPAVAVLTAVLAAVAVRLPRLEPGRDDDAEGFEWAADSGRRGRAGAAWVPPTLAAGVLAACVLSLNAPRVAEAADLTARRYADALRQRQWQGSDEQFARLITAANDAAEAAPRDVQYAYRLNLYRWRAISRVTDPLTGGLVLGEEEVGFARRIAEELADARAMCPTFGPAAVLEGQLQLYVLGNTAGAALIRLGQRLAPHDPNAALLAAQLAIDAGDPDAAAALFQRAVALDANLAGPALSYLAVTSGRADLAYALAVGNRTQLELFVRLMTEAGRGADPAAVQAHADARTLLMREAQSDGATPGVLASLGIEHAREGHYADAVAYLRRALAQDYGQVNWRLELARALAAQDNIKDAAREARICLRLRPQFRGAEQLLAELSVRPDFEQP